VPGTLHDVDFMVKDSKRFADGGGWGYAVFDYDAGADTFTPGTLAGNPPQGNDAKCGFACHTIVKARDYVLRSMGSGEPVRAGHRISAAADARSKESGSASAGPQLILRTIHIDSFCPGALFLNQRDGGARSGCRQRPARPRRSG